MARRAWKYPRIGHITFWTHFGLILDAFWTHFGHCIIEYARSVSSAAGLARNFDLNFLTLVQNRLHVPILHCSTGAYFSINEIVGKRLCVKLAASRGKLIRAIRVPILNHFAPLTVYA